MKQFLIGAAVAALVAAAPASAQLLGGGGGLGGGLSGPVGGLGGNIGGTLGGGIERGGRIAGDTGSRVRSSARVERELRNRRGERVLAGTVEGGAASDRSVRLGERRIVTDGSSSAFANLSMEQRLLRTRGAVAATRRGLRRVAPTASGVQVFVPRVAVTGPTLPRVAVTSFPAYSSAYYYEPGAVFVGSSHTRVYVDQQYQDLETSLRGSGATVTRRGDDLVVLFPADVTFAFDKADIRSRFYGPLNAFAETLNAYPGSDIEILGHTDSVGSDSYNLTLSERRGRSVADFLADRQVTPTRMVVEAMGEGEPVATNATVEGRAANRRVEMIVHPRAG